MLIKLPLLAAMASLSLVCALSVRAQDNKAVDPTATPQEINEKTNGTRSQNNAVAPSAPKTPEQSGTAKDTVAPGSVTITVGDTPHPEETEGPVYLADGQTMDTLVVRDRPLHLAGQVLHDVVAINSDVTIEASAKVGGRVVVIGGNIQNRAGDKIVVVRQSSSAEAVTFDNASHLLMIPRLSGDRRATAPERSDWLGGQFALLLLGLLGGLLLLTIAPRATQQCATFMALEPARCLIIGLIGSLASLVVVGLNAALLHSPLRLIYAPVGLLVGYAPIVALAFGWLCGMRWMGDVVARKLRWADRGRLYSRMALGLVAFFLLNAFLGSLNGFLGVCGLVIETGIAITGLGALIVTGFGKDPDWLGARLRGEARWFAWRR